MPSEYLQGALDGRTNGDKLRDDRNPVPQFLTQKLTLKVIKMTEDDNPNPPLPRLITKKYDP